MRPDRPTQPPSLRHRTKAFTAFHIYRCTGHSLPGITICANPLAATFGDVGTFPHALIFHVDNEKRGRGSHVVARKRRGSGETSVRVHRLVPLPVSCVLDRS